MVRTALLERGHRINLGSGCRVSSENEVTSGQSEEFKPIRMRKELFRIHSLV